VAFPAKSRRSYTFPGTVTSFSVFFEKKAASSKGTKDLSKLLLTVLGAFHVKS
jgi:hypothetical protein